MVEAKICHLSILHHKKNNRASRCLPTTMADATPLIDPIQKDVEGTKQGSKYYGCCCDSRRAVIALNTLDIVFNFALNIAVIVEEEAMNGEQAAVWIVNQVRYQHIHIICFMFQLIPT